MFKKAILFSTFLFAASSWGSLPPSVLNERVDLAEFGGVAYRKPLEEAKGPVILLLQGVFGGTTHRHMTELRQGLDRLGYRVFTLDLPGTGESNSPKIHYTFPLLSRFVEDFLVQVVQQKAIVVAEQVMGLASLKVAQNRPDLFERIVFLGPTGVLYLSNPPNEAQKKIYERYWNDEDASLSFYKDLVSEKSARYYLEKAYFNPKLVTSDRIDEITLTQNFSEQRWATISFVAGLIQARFAEVSTNLRIPVDVVIGRHVKSPITNGPAETLEMFRSIQPDFSYFEIDDTANLPHRESPGEVIQIITSSF